MHTYTIEKERIAGLNPYLFGERLKDELSLIFPNLHILLVYGRDSEKRSTLQLQFTVGTFAKTNSKPNNQLKSIDQEITNVCTHLTARLLEQISTAKLSAA